MKNSNLIKPYLTQDEQINKLINQYGLIIRNREFAKILLKNLSYYDLINGYKKCFIKNGKYLDGITIEDLYFFLDFDRDFQNILFKYSFYVENKFKNILSNYLAETFGIEVVQYLDPNNFRRGGIYVKDTISKIKDIPNSKYASSATKHYRDTKNHIPPWILFKDITFNQSIDIYRNLKYDDKLFVTKSILNSSISEKNMISILTNALIIIRKFRNIIAHNHNFVTYRSKEKLILNQLVSTTFSDLVLSEDFKNNVGANDAYAFILSLSIILNEKLLVSKMYYDLSRQILISTELTNDHMEIFSKYCEITSIPENLISRFENYLEN